MQPPARRYSVATAEVRAPVDSLAERVRVGRIELLVDQGPAVCALVSVAEDQTNVVLCSGGADMTRTEPSREDEPIMGRPSDKQRSARRPGKAERARVKKHRRTIVYGVSGDGTAGLRLGEKKLARYFRARLSILSVNHIPKAGSPMPNGQTIRQAGAIPVQSV